MPRIVIILDVEGSEAGALHVIDALLDSGHVQDAINKHEHEDVGPLHVTMAIARLDPARPRRFPGSKR